MFHSKTCLGGMVTAPHHLAAQAGAEVLKEGGNAVEAAVAAAATIAVVYPHMNSIGGDGFWLISEPGKPPVAIQACGPAAGLATKRFYQEHRDDTIPTRGPRAALTVPGAVSGWACALEYASLWKEAEPMPLELLLASAIRHARNGIVVSESQASLTRAKWAEIGEFEPFASIYRPKDILCTGDIITQADLGDTLDHLGHNGLDDFYRGDVAVQLAAGLKEAGSPIRLNDLQAYHAKLVPPLVLKIRNCSLFNHPLPTQGISSLMILGIFEQLGVDRPESFAHIHGLVEATKRAFIMRNKYVGDPSLVSEDYVKWLTPGFIRGEAAEIDRNRALCWPYEAERGDTVWLGAADSEGRVVSYIQSIFWEFGSGFVAPGTGVIVQNRGASFTLSPGPRELAPGRLPFHTLNPALARFDDGRVMAYGTMGGEGQPQTQAALFTRYATWGIDLQTAISEPRWLLGKTWGAEESNLKVESRFSPELLKQLEKAGHDIEIVGSYDDLMGHAGAIVVHQGGLIEGATDPRADGICAGL